MTKKELEDYCKIVMENNDRVVEKAKYLDTKCTRLLNHLVNLTAAPPCDYDEDWWERNKQWCCDNCDDNWTKCWSKYVDDEEVKEKNESSCDYGDDF